MFRLLIGTIHNAVFLGELSLHYDANVHTQGSYLGWLIIFAPVLGGQIVVYLIRNFAPEAKGHGVPEVMHAIYHKRGIIPGKVSIVKAFASAITIGTGGSLGREGPIVQISAAFSSFIGQITRLTVSQRNLVIACGASSGIAATFNAPLGGILFSIELLLVAINSRTVLPVALSTVIAANVGHYLIGNDPAFVIPEILHVSKNSDIYVSLLAIPLGAFVGLLSLLFILSIYFFEDQFEKFPVNDYQRHAIGTLLLGIMFYSLYARTGHYYVQGVGYATIQDVLMNLITDPWFLLFLIFAKLLATGLTIGSGGSGGVFSPSLFLGALSGALFGSIVGILFPNLGINPIVFVIAGMAAMVSGTTSAPLTATIIVFEMTLDYNAILPVIAAVSVAYAVRRRFLRGDIYTLKLNRRGQMVPEELVADIGSHVLIDDEVSKNIAFVKENERISGAQDYACILDDQDKVAAIIDLSSQSVDHEVPLMLLKRRKHVVLKSGTRAAKALRILHQKKCDVALISATGGTEKEAVVGVLSAAHLVNLLGDVTKTLR
ncbi:MAG: chloride channel protein [Gammaproteobacteria bacterium]|nr:chloride channel protein [Gammaproteobacteria bacterium]